MVTKASGPRTSIIDPLRSDAFRLIWIASFCMNTGLFVQDLGAAWLMTSLSKNPIMVALMQTAAMLPYFLLCLPAGAGADLINRRKLLLGGQTWLIFAAGTLAVVTLSGHVNAWMLLALTFFLYVGNAVNSPAWNVVIPGLVPRRHLESAVSLSNAGYNLARGLGAVLGGLIVASFGSGWAFAVSSACFCYMLLTLWRWSYDAKPVESSEDMLTAIKSGLRYVKHSPVLTSVLVRTALYILPVSIMWSLLPLLAREHFHMNSTQYGMIVAAFGLGTLLGAFTQPRLRQHVSLDGLSSIGTLMFSSAFVILALANHFALAALAMMLCGIGWTTKNSALNISVQLSAPNWVRARAYSVYLFVFQGSIAIGAVAWGAVASWQGMSVAFIAAAVLLLVELIGKYWYKLSHAETLDLSSSTHWKMPLLTHVVPDDGEGPVMVTVSYTIDPAAADKFLEALGELEIQRRRDGAFQWYVFRDLEDESRFCETFFVDSWGEHVRQHNRVVMSDKAVEQRVDSFHIGGGKPLVNHYLAAAAGKSAATIRGASLQKVQPLVSRRR